MKVVIPGPLYLLDELKTEPKSDVNKNKTELISRVAANYPKNKDNLMETLQTIDEIVEQLLKIKKEYGNLSVAQIFFGSEDYPKIEVESYKPCVVTNPLDKSKYLVIFD